MPSVTEIFESIYYSQNKNENGNQISNKEQYVLAMISYFLTPTTL